MNFGLDLGILNRMRLWQKFLLLGIFALGAVAFPFYKYVQGAEADIAFARQERLGLPPVLAAVRVMDLAQQHRGLSANLLSGNDAASQPRTAKEAEVNQSMADVDKAMVGFADAGLNEAWSKIKGSWKLTTNGVSGRTLDAAISFRQHTELVLSLQLFLEQIADLSKLSLDPTSHTYFLVQAVTVHLPKLTEAMAQMRGLGTGRLAEAEKSRASKLDTTQVVTESDRVRLTSSLRDMSAGLADSYRFIGKAMSEEPRIKPALEAQLAQPRDAARAAEGLVRKEIVDAKLFNYDANTYFQTMTAAIDVQYKFLGNVAQVLDQELDLIIADKRRAELTISLQVLAALLVALVVGVLTVRNVRLTVGSLQASVERVRAGDETALGNIAAQDEVGDLGRTVNSLLTERITAQKKAESENEGLNNSVISILQSVYQLSQRDLTARAVVTPDIIGTVSDSINALTDETSKVLHGVSRIAGQVATASGKVQSQAALVAKTAGDGRASVDVMMGSLAGATQTMNQVSALAEQTNKSAALATQATGDALETVNATVKGMESIRETIAETEKRIKRLGERSQEISGIVNLINTISERTHVLALNASMQAAVAGEAGRGFAVVAEEVQRLAESSRNATQQIGTLVTNIQLETNETISTVNRTIGQVVQGSEQAQKAGEQMRRTQDITGQLVAQVRQIADASELQKGMSAGLLTAMQNIGAGTEQTATQIAAQNVETESLLGFARNLVESVNVFKLPQAV